MKDTAAPISVVHLHRGFHVDAFPIRSLIASLEEVDQIGLVLLIPYDWSYMLVTKLYRFTKAAPVAGLLSRSVPGCAQMHYSKMVLVPVHPDEQKFVDTALRLVKDAGRLVRDAFDQTNCVVKTKASDVDLVTETDQAVEKLLIEGLSKAFPDHRFIGEESTANGAKVEYTNAPTWIIDPIDGTTNFVHRIPLVAICVGLAINKELRAGIVYNPISRELFFAQVGCGAFKNGFPIHVSSTTAISNSVVITQLGSHRHPEMLHSYSSSYKTLMVDQNCHGHRCFGSAAINMMMVAQGACDAMVEYGLHAWDVAAAAVIVSEAGGCIIDPTGEPFNVMSRKVLCASTKELAQSLSSILTHAEFDPEG